MSTRNKASLRQELRKQRRTMSPNDVVQLSRIITDQVFAVVDWRAVNQLHTYLPLAHHQEVDVTPLLRLLRQYYPHISVATWIYTDNGLSSQWVQPDNQSALVSADVQFDSIIVPLLGFNDDCFRIGFGGGIYDRFLATQPQALTIGLGYEFGHISFEPEKHDVPLTQIVSEIGVYRLTA